MYIWTVTLTYALKSELLYAGPRGSGRGCIRASPGNKELTSAVLSWLLSVSDTACIAPEGSKLSVRAFYHTRTVYTSSTAMTSQDAVLAKAHDAGLWLQRCLLPMQPQIVHQCTEYSHQIHAVMLLLRHSRHMADSQQPVNDPVHRQAIPPSGAGL